MEPIKRDGKIREQLNREEKSRREYSKKWSFMSKPELNRFYEQDHLNEQVNILVPKEKHPLASYEYSDHGDSYFVSEGMYGPLNLCRCGRKKEGTHHLKCLSSCKIKYSVDEADVDSEDHKESKLTIPRTSNGRCGWPLPGKYLAWEKSTYYISPKTLLLTPKVTQHPYSSIILG